MFSPDKNIYLQETETKPNKYATFALVFSLIGIVFCWLLNEIGIFRVGDVEMRIGSIISLIVVAIPLILLFAKHDISSSPSMKYIVISSATVFTLTVTTLLTFHTTIMLLFPIFIGMLYRSHNLGKIAFAGSLTCTVISPILGYLLGTWDIDLFKELILIGTNGTAIIEGAYSGISLTSILKILLYIVLPRLTIVGSCTVLMFYVISVGVDHVNNQIKLNDLSHKDVLTGLFNRNYLNSIIGDKNLKGKCAIMFFDVNGLKQVNDRLGHEAGDLMLKKSAECLGNVCLDNNAGAFRMGGDEFLILSFDVDEAQVKSKLKEIDSLIKASSESPELKQNNIPLSIAAGYALGDFSDVENLIHLADTNMYINKKAMRDKT